MTNLASPAKILVVDDDKNICNACRYSLEADGYQVEMAFDGQQALERLDKNVFDMILTDLQMPKLDGLGLLREVQARPKAPPVVMFTAYASVQSAVEAMKLGAYDYLPKPVDLAHLSRTVQRCVETHRLKKQVSELQQIAKLHALSKALNESLDLPVVLKTILRETCSLANAEAGSILLPEAAQVGSTAGGAGPSTELRAGLVVRETFGDYPEPVVGKRVAVGEAVAGRVARDRQPLTLRGPLQDNPDFTNLATRAMAWTSVVAPLQVGDQFVGVLCLKRVKNVQPFTEEERGLILIAAQSAALALCNASSFDELKLSRADLENQVEARTAELQQTLAHLKNSQNQLIEQAKLAALGKLSSEVAHELRNPLAVAYTGLQVLRTYLGKTEASPAAAPAADGNDLDVPKAWDTVIRNINRANEVINSFLALSRSSELVLTPQDALPMIRDVEAMIRGKCVHQRVALDVRVPEKLPPVRLSVPHFKSTLLNLAINALEALPPEGGRLSLAAQRLEDQGVAFIVEDNGPGIPAELQGRIFEAFFTTKKKGAGLGLSIVKEIVEKHKGTLELLSDPKKGGTRFTIRLPAVEA